MANSSAEICHYCCHPLSVVADSTFRSASSLRGAGSVSASTHVDHSFIFSPMQKSHNHTPGLPPRPRGVASVHIDNSFIVLPKQKSQYHTPGLPPRPRGVASTHIDHSFVVLPKKKYQYQSQSQSLGFPPCERGGALHHQMTTYGKSIEESFVVLPHARDSVYTSDITSHNEGVNAHFDPNASGLHTTITALNQAFQIVTSKTEVEQPLCLECMRVLSKMLEKEVQDINRDIKAYNACLKLLKSEAHVDLSEPSFLKEKQMIEEESRKLEAAIAETEKQCAVVDDELEELELKSNCLKVSEDRYWHEFNNFQFQLQLHQEKREAIHAEIEVSLLHLELLKQTNVLDDAFPIWHDGEFGTINNFRLGRLPEVLGEWDEINAAWGQACLLLHMICQSFLPKFHYRIKILPMGSYPRIMDTNNNTYDLFGPVDLFWSSHYDKAMLLYSTCLKDLAEFARDQDLENNIPPDKCFKLPYRIENDKVETYAITKGYNGQENWTNALKCTLDNLKCVLNWYVGNTDFQPPSGEAPSQAEFPSLGGSRTRRPGSSRLRPDSRKPSGA